MPRPRATMSVLERSWLGCPVRSSGLSGLLKSSKKPPPIHQTEARLIRGAVVLARKNLQVSNAIFVIENLVATTVLWFLAACEFSVRSFLQPPWLVWLEPVG